MKRCNACDEEYENNFSFCPLDRSPLNDLAAARVGKETIDDGRRTMDPRQAVNTSGASRRIGLGDDSIENRATAVRREFNVTMISSARLPQRLAAEVSFVAHRIKQAWPEFKRDPIAVGKHGAFAIARRLKALMLAPNVLAATVTAVSLVFAAILTVILLGNATPPRDALADQFDPETVEIVNLIVPNLTQPEGSGVGVGSNGRVGLNAGKGEGSEAGARQSRGGGGSGDHDPLPSQQGKVQQPSEIPAPINPTLPHAALPVAGVDLDPVLFKNLPFSNYGDPRSSSTAPSKGPGEGGAVGAGNGLGNGNGDGNGVGPGRSGNIGDGDNTRGCCGPGGADGNDPRDANRIFRVDQLTQRPRVSFKPEPQYTEEARRNQITGTVILRAVFSASGDVISIRAIKLLPGGLTEKAIAAAHLIRFLPATRNGQPVSVYMQLEYNFNLY